jgi:hypothetical protein
VTFSAAAALPTARFVAVALVEFRLVVPGLVPLVAEGPALVALGRVLLARLARPRRFAATSLGTVVGSAAVGAGTDATGTASVGTAVAGADSGAVDTTDVASTGAASVSIAAATIGSAGAGSVDFGSVDFGSVDSGSVDSGSVDTGSVGASIVRGRAAGATARINRSKSIAGTCDPDKPQSSAGRMVTFLIRAAAASTVTRTVMLAPWPSSGVILIVYELT